MHQYPPIYHQGMYRTVPYGNQRDQRFVGPFIPFLTGLAVAPLFYGAFRPPYPYPPYPYYPPYGCRPYACPPYYRPYL
ncbi:hypothetical protein IMZ31_07520 [Pontibacillus sp. ALD_SL1]|uniref:hypothetical protein n=1 Tax=Pontibacillus sp. ALD_SL1 TaxID=2777185 RepID=UPI001A963811|nr:hypothetical protein [Pontibacillus sp. ALD_SL1]QST01397.1 hypothetical protein IMZ31_07520 [Pontibacillus sp. ALD_SL1]